MTRITESAAAFASELSYSALPEEALRIGRRCILDGLGQFAGGVDTKPVRLIAEDVAETGGKAEARLLGHRVMVPAPLAARVLGTAGHAMDWDDTQATNDPRHTYGLLTHPTVPPLAVAVVLAQALRPVTGKAFMTAFQAGFEVECKIAEWMLPDAYRRGLHASAAEGTIGAAVTAAKLMGLDQRRMKTAIGIACSMASAGIRANVGTETKPLHFGRAAENGLIAAQLARRGLESGEAPLDGSYGFLSVFSGGYFEEKLEEGFGRTYSIIDPGVSVKPYPSGILSHQAMDAMLELVVREDVKPEAVEKIDFYAGSNILNPLAYRFATDHMNAKFCIPALLSMIVLRRRAGKQEFIDDFVTAPEMVRMQRLCAVHLDPKIEDQGFDRIRSRIEVTLKDGRRLSQTGDERYRGSPQWPISDAGLEEKLRAATDGVLSPDRQRQLIEASFSIDAPGNSDSGQISDILP